MTIRNAVLGFTVAFGVGVWAWCRPCGSQAHAQGAGAVVAADESAGGNRDEALARYRCNHSSHWRQVALGH